MLSSCNHSICANSKADFCRKTVLLFPLIYPTCIPTVLTLIIKVCVRIISQTDIYENNLWSKLNLPIVSDHLSFHENHIWTAKEKVWEPLLYHWAIAPPKSGLILVCKTHFRTKTHTHTHSGFFATWLFIQGRHSTAFQYVIFFSSSPFIFVLY